MKQISLLTGALALLLTGGCDSLGNWSQPTVKGSGTIIKEARAVAGFSRVNVSGAGRLIIRQGDTEGLTIETDDNLLPHILSTVSNGVLSIGPDQVSPRPSREIRYVLDVKKLKSVHLSGSLHVEAEALRADRIEFGISGSGSVRVADLTTGDCKISISGSGSVDLAGEATRQSFGVSGSGALRAGALAGQVVRVRISGSGKATVRVSEELDVQVSGSGSVNYYGRPRITQSISGSGRLRALSDE